MCIFCKIINGEIKSDFVYQDKEIVAFSDINPKAQTHILIVPRKHVVNINNVTETDKSMLGNMFLVAKRVAKEQAVDTGYKLQINNGKGAGQEVDHLHMHLLAN